MWRVPVIGLLYLSALTSGEQPNIIIIGAGPAGIAAASKLFENGYQNVTILEAENRIGGRVYSTRFDDSWVDLGGQWVEGQTNNIVYELASPLGLLTVPPERVDLGFTVYSSEGRQIPTSISDSLLQFFFDIEQPDINLNGINGSLGEYYTGILNEEFKKYPTINDTLAGEFIRLFESFTMSVDASDNWYETSARGTIESWKCPGWPAMTWKDRSYGTILDILMKRYPNPEEELPVLNNTLLASEVDKIDYNSTEGKAVITTIGGEQYIADHVITTPSLGVLKAQYKTLFTPQLPDAKVKTINGLSFGTAAKIFLSFDEPWWPENFTDVGFIWDTKDRQEYQSDPEKKWLLDLNIFAKVADRPRLLCAWLSGASARHMETLPEDQVFNQTLEVLNKFLGKSFNITRPTGMLRTNWYSNKHFRGTWSFRSMESERANVWPDGLAAPILVNEKPIVLFAGEATHPLHYGFVHGAIESGFREANRIIDLYSRNPNENLLERYVILNEQRISTL